MLKFARYPRFGTDGVVVFPFHNACYELLIKAIKRYAEAPLDEEILYFTFVHFANANMPWLLDIDYGAPAPKDNPKTFGLYPNDPTIHHDWWKNYGNEVTMPDTTLACALVTYYVKGAPQVP